MPGSDQKINYQIRPAKSVERKMFCDLVREIQLLQGSRELRYIGLGAKYFTDFLLLHNEFAITDMISIEAEKERQIRYDFNKPLKCIEMRYGNTNEILPQLDGFNEKTNLVWLDYDDSFNKDMLVDIETLCRNLDVGSMFFISCNYSCGGQNPSEKQSFFKENVGDFFDDEIETSNYTTKKIPLIIRKTINRQIEKVLGMRNRIQSRIHYDYLQLIFLTYKDGAPMMTIGGIILNEEIKERLEESALLSRYAFLSDNENVYNIDIPKLTNKEIQLILKKIPITEEEYEEQKADFFGIDYDEIRKFEKIYRYYPYYSEGYFAT